MKLTIQLKGITPESTWEDKCLALQNSAYFMQGLNKVMAPLLIHGDILCNPEAMVFDLETGTWKGTPEGFLGSVNALPNSAGVLDIIIENYAGLKIPSLPVDCPFSLYIGDSSEQIPVLDEKGNPVLNDEKEPVYETILSGGIAGE